jgi:hypothetical protein
MKKRLLTTIFILIGIICLGLGGLAGYIWGGWYEWEKGYRFALRQICAGEVETVKANKQTLLVSGAGEE